MKLPVLTKNLKPKRCKICHKLMGDHKANTMECPKGPLTRIGYLDYTEGTKYEG